MFRVPMAKLIVDTLPQTVQVNDVCCCLFVRLDGTLSDTASVTGGMRVKAEGSN